MPGEEYLNYPKYEIKKFIGEKAKKALFLPYAGVSMTYETYTKKVQQRFNEIGFEIENITEKKDPVQAIKEAEIIVVGGGNTFELIRQIQDNNLIEPIREKVMSGTPYIGWSAGSNVACPTIRTTNDMPIVEPKSFDACNLVPFQINPHYLDANPDGHAGETREQRINEFMVLNKDTTVVGLREGSMLIIEDKKVSLIGEKSLRIFKYGKDTVEITKEDNLDFLLTK